MLNSSECLLVKGYVITRGGSASSDARISTGHNTRGELTVPRGFTQASVSHSEIVDAAGGAPTRRASAVAGHHGLRPGAHEERVLAGLEVLVDHNAIGADRDMFGLKWNFLVALDARFAAREPAE